MISQIQSNYTKAQAAGSNLSNVERIRAPRRANAMDSVSFSGKFTSGISKKAGGIFKGISKKAGNIFEGAKKFAKAGYHKVADLHLATKAKNVISNTSQKVVDFFRGIPAFFKGKFAGKKA